jgi:hypothetical protein
MTASRYVRAGPELGEREHHKLCVADPDHGGACEDANGTALPWGPTE